MMNEYLLTMMNIKMNAENERIKNTNYRSNASPNKSSAPKIQGTEKKSDSQEEQKKREAGQSSKQDQSAKEKRESDRASNRDLEEKIEGEAL